MPKKILFIDRDGTLVREAPPTYQLDDFKKLEFYPHVFESLSRIASQKEYELVMVTNQDGLGTDSFPENTFWPVQDFIIKAFENEGVFFSKICIDRSFPYENAPTRKPCTGMLTQYLDNEEYDIKNSFVIGDRITDVKLAANLGCKAIWLNNHSGLGSNEVKQSVSDLAFAVALETQSWKDIYSFLRLPGRKITHVRDTNETKINVEINLDGNGITKINTGLGFFDHMLDQLGKHAAINIFLSCVGDLCVDEHHTIEDVAIALGESFSIALGNKKGIERYGFVLPMDDCLAQAAIDFGGRSWLVWDVNFTREKIGDMPTEMFFHFFKSFSDAAKCNINIKAYGINEHHKIEAIFKAFARVIKMAIKRDPLNNSLPSTKGLL